MHVHGKCHCGAIAYEADVDPNTVRICHCTDCQTLTGSAYRVLVRAPAAGFRLKSGTPKLYVRTSDSGAKRGQAGCPDCGTPLYAAALENPAFYVLRLGAGCRAFRAHAQGPSVVPLGAAMVGRSFRD